MCFTIIENFLAGGFRHLFDMEMWIILFFKVQLAHIFFDHFSYWGIHRLFPGTLIHFRYLVLGQRRIFFVKLNDKKVPWNNLLSFLFRHFVSWRSSQSRGNRSWRLWMFSTSGNRRSYNRWGAGRTLLFLISPQKLGFPPVSHLI